MIVYRKELLASLEACAPGLNTKENVEQSQCYTFRDGKVSTFNDLIFCQHDVPIDFTGAVPSRQLRETLQKLTEDELDISATDSELRMKGTGRRVVIKFTKELYLPFSSIETPEHWVDVAPAFSDALPLAADCCSKDGAPPEFDCVSFTENSITACDKYQAIRFSVPTELKPCLVSGVGCKSVNSLGVSDSCETENWVHWRTFTGLRVSVRKSIGDYPQLEVFDNPAIAEVEIPHSVSEAMLRATPFLSESADGRLGQIALKSGSLSVRAKNIYGWYEERHDVEYDGPDLVFSVNPKLIGTLLKHGEPVKVTENTLRVDGESYSYVVSTQRPK